LRSPSTNAIRFLKGDLHHNETYPNDNFWNPS
jgi:hypothetical protein